MSNHNSYNTYHPTNHNRIFNDKGFIVQLNQEIRNKLGRQLNRTEKLYMINALKSINPAIFRNRTIPEIIALLSDTIAEGIVKNVCPDSSADINIHEMLKSELGVSTEDNPSFDAKSERDFTTQITATFANQVEIVSLLGNRTVADLQKIINPDLVKQYIYILLDSRYRVLDTDGTTTLRWNFVNNEATAQGSVNAIGNIKDITAMRISPVRIPYNSQADTDYDRVSIFIQEISAQSVIAQENRRYHFLFRVNASNRWLDLEPENFNDGYFRFRNPITRLETMTLSFGSPLEPITFTTDRMLANITSYAATTEFTTVSPHNIETGDLIYISNFSTANNNTENVIFSAINRASGHIAIVTGLSTFTIDIVSTSIRTIGTGTVNVTNGSAIVTGTGTSFGTFLAVNDSIEISGVLYSILSIQTQTQLTLKINYLGTTAGGLVFHKNNILNGIRPTVYFGSKRIFIPIEIEYYAA
jgi:hypothetical protein